MRITQKITIGYVVLILIPVIAFGYHYYSQIYEGLKVQYVESRQKILEQAYANIKVDFSRIQSINRLMQYNSYVTDYLDGVNNSEADSVYSFLKYIQPLFGQSLFANSEIDSLVIYKVKEDVFSIPDYLVDWSLLDPRIEAATHRLKPGTGLWVRINSNSIQPELIYFQNIYNTQFTEKIGLLEIRINNSVFEKFYEAGGVKEPWNTFFITKSDELIAHSLMKPEVQLVIEQLVNTKTEHHTFFVKDDLVVNQLWFEELDLIVIVTGNVSEVFHTITRTEVIVILLFIIILISLSLVYYMMASSITKRIMRLARHMRKLEDGSFKANIVKQTKINKKDEISFLIETYNLMLYRMDELINNVHRVELLNKEAAYKVLQAQIKPHFLYNTIETIRMLAVTNNDKEVADITFWFGKLMRYSLSSDDEVITLAQEIEMANFYLQIHKMRLQSRLTYEIDELCDTTCITCPRFILQPLVENSINHGVSTVIRPVNITITASETEDEIIVKVQDNGYGIAKAKLLTIKAMLIQRGNQSGASTVTGVGLINVNDRIKAFFGESSRLEIESEEGKGTTLKIVIKKRRAS